MRWASGHVSVSSSPVRDRSAHGQPLAARRRPISSKSSTRTPVSQYSGGNDHALDGDALRFVACVAQQAQGIPRVAQAVEVDQHLIQVGDGRKPDDWLRVVGNLGGIKRPPANTTGGHLYSANISASSARTASCADEPMRPSRLTSRVLSTVRIWSSTI